MALNGPLKESTKEEFEYEMWMMDRILNYSLPETAFDFYSKESARDRIRMRILYNDYMGRYKELSEYKDTLYRSWIQTVDETNSDEMNDIVASFYNQKIEMDNRRLLIERQRLDNERQHADIENANLELANTELTLRNSSLELSKEREHTASLQLLNSNKHLEAERLKSMKEDQRLRRDTIHLYTFTIITIFVVLLITGLCVLSLYRRMTRRLRDTHSKLAVNHRELEEAHKRAVAADRVKTFLLQNASHDVNEPLESIVGFARLIADSKHELTVEQRAEYMRRIHENTDEMLGLVGELLEKAQKE